MLDGHCHPGTLHLGSLARVKNPKLHRQVARGARGPPGYRSFREHDPVVQALKTAWRAGMSRAMSSSGKDLNTIQQQIPDKSSRGCRGFEGHHDIRKRAGSFEDIVEAPLRRYREELILNIDTEPALLNIKVQRFALRFITHV
jgi:hypothetical protein